MWPKHPPEPHGTSDHLAQRLRDSTLQARQATWYFYEETIFTKIFLSIREADANILTNKTNTPDHSMADKCIYCGSSSYGSCSRSPNGKHEHQGNEKECKFCGSSSYGSCSRSPHGRHQHGHGKEKCVYCGSTSVGSCSRSPHGRHER